MLTFWEFIHRDSPLPESEKVLVLIRQAGPQGIDRGSIGANIKLEKETLDQLLDALIGFGQIVATRKDGLITYRTPLFPGSGEDQRRGQFSSTARSAETATRCFRTTAKC